MNVVSDLEGTLTEGATWVGMADYLKQHGHSAEYWLRFALITPRFTLAKLRLADEQNMKNDWLTQLLGMMRGLTEAEFGSMCQYVVEQVMWPKRRQDVLAEFEQRRQDGARIIVASGTFQPIADGFARRIGGEALGTQVELRDGRLTGRLIGEVSVRDTKARRIRELLGDQPVDFAYGDSTSDVPLLELAGTPVAVYPNDGLRRVAAERGWRIIGPG